MLKYIQTQRPFKENIKYIWTWCPWLEEKMGNTGRQTPSDGLDTLGRKVGVLKTQCPVKTMPHETELG